MISFVTDLRLCRTAGTLLRYYACARVRSEEDNTFGAELAMKGVGLQTIQQLMGRSGLATTRRYLDPTPKHNREAVPRLVPQSGTYIAPQAKIVEDLDPRRQAAFLKERWSQLDSNQRPPACEAGALAN